MLNKDTLELIIANAAAAQQLPVTAFPVAALPEGVKLHNLERYAAGRSRFRGTLTTHSLTDFAGYVVDRRSSSNPVAAFVNQDGMSCTAFFNLGDEIAPGHADDTATLTLKATAAFRALQSIVGRKLSQRDLAEWLEDWHHMLIARDTSGGPLHLAQAIAAVRNITIKASVERNHNESNFGAARSAMDEIEARSQDTLPAELVFTFVPYDGLTVFAFTLRLSVLTGDDKPALKLRWVGEEQQREHIAQEFKDTLAAALGAAAVLTLGTFNPDK